MQVIFHRRARREAVLLMFLLPNREHHLCRCSAVDGLRNTHTEELQISHICAEERLYWLHVFSRILLRLTQPFCTNVHREEPDSLSHSSATR